MTTPVSTPNIDVQERVTSWAQLLPPWRVMLHNDNHNSMDHVLMALLDTVQSLTPDQAVQIMLEAHTSGVALVVVTPKERAEFYSERLHGFGLTSTIEPA